MGIEMAKLIDIGKQAGCTTGAITHYFADKNEVLVAAWDYAYKDLMKKIEEVSDREPYSLIGVLSESLPITPRSCILTKVWMTLTIRSLHNSVLSRKQIETFMLWNKRIQKELRKAQQLGVFDRQIDLDFESQVISVAINGICLRAIIDPNDWPRSRQIKFLSHHVDRLVTGYSTRLHEYCRS
jgi:AcrR family transcriptional regulator